MNTFAILHSVPWGNCTVLSYVIEARDLPALAFLPSTSRPQPCPSIPSRLGVNAYQLKIAHSQALLFETQSCDSISYTIIAVHAGIFPSDGFVETESLQSSSLSRQFLVRPNSIIAVWNCSKITLAMQFTDAEAADVKKWVVKKLEDMWVDQTLWRGLGKESND